jgi:hypothetical protein
MAQNYLSPTQEKLGQDSCQVSAEQLHLNRVEKNRIHINGLLRLTVFSKEM